MAWLAFFLYIGGVATAFGLRSWLHRRMTGDSGHRHSHPAAGSAAWWAQILLAAGLLAGSVSPLLDALDVLRPVAFDHTGLRVAGLAAAVLGFTGIPLAQHAMGRSWRVGVDTAERTTLVTGGVFRLVRNPVFTAMIVAVAGLTAMSPTWAQIATLATVIIGIELQVRAVEEPYLRRMHGAAYHDYAGRTGRFLPLLGRTG